MYPRTEYEMSEDDLKELMEACKPTPCIMVGGYSPPTPQENANRVWAALGKKMGFDSTTVQPMDGKGTRHFTAVSSETDAQKTERMAREKEEKRQTDIARIKKMMGGLADELKALEGGE